MKITHLDILKLLVETIRDDAKSLKLGFSIDAVLSISDIIEENIDGIRREAIEEAARVAYNNPHYVMNALETDADGWLMPGSPYDRGRYDAAKEILKL